VSNGETGRPNAAWWLSRVVFSLDLSLLPSTSNHSLLPVTALPFIFFMLLHF
jgi:hypothetical protein